MTAIESFTEGNFTVDIFHDEDCESPRSWDGHFLWLGFPHRNYNIGDETIDPSTITEDCPNEKCDGGRIYPDETDYADWGTCPTCEGAAEIEPRNMEQLIEMVTRKYEANLVVPVGMIDHSGVSYYLGGGAHWCDPGGWDSGTCGLMLFTEQHIKDWGADMDDDEVRKSMAAELAEYTDWANGSCYGYVVRLSDDFVPSEEDHGNWVTAITVGGFTGSYREWLKAKYDPDDSCWGLIGWEYAESQARQALKNAQPKETTCK